MAPGTKVRSSYAKCQRNHLKHSRSHGWGLEQNLKVAKIYTSTILPTSASKPPWRRWDKLANRFQKVSFCYKAPCLLGKETKSDSFLGGGRARGLLQSPSVTKPRGGVHFCSLSEEDKGETEERVCSVCMCTHTHTSGSPIRAHHLPNQCLKHTVNPRTYYSGHWIYHLGHSLLDVTWATQVDTLDTFFYILGVFCALDGACSITLSTLVEKPMESC